MSLRLVRVRILLLTILTLALVSCDSNDRSRSDYLGRVSDPLEVPARIHYYLDTRTSLCFAAVSITDYAISIATVPCSDKVLSEMNREGHEAEAANAPGAQHGAP